MKKQVTNCLLFTEKLNLGNQTASSNTGTKPSVQLPKQVLLNVNTASVQALWPCYFAFHNERRQAEELKASLEALKEAPPWTAFDKRSERLFRVVRQML